MNVLRVFLILNLFLLNRASFSSDEWIGKPVFGQLISYFKAYSNIQLSVESLLPRDLSTKHRLNIIKSVPDLQPFPRIDSASDTEFVDKVKKEVVDAAMNRSMVLLSNLNRACYEQRVVENNIQLRKMADGENLTDPTGGSVVRTYWKNFHSNLFYDIDEETSECHVGYNPDEIRRRVAESAKLIAKVVMPVEVSRIEKECNETYAGRARYTLDTCANTHSFHSGCIKKAHTVDSRCPTCRVGFTKRDLKFNPSYKTGEECAICMDPIVPTDSTKDMDLAGAVAASNASGRGTKRARS